MKYIKVSFDKMPQVLFSHKHEAPAYTYHFSETDRFLEICFIDVGDLFSEKYNGEVNIHKAGSLGTSWQKAKTVSSHGCFHRHFTVAIGGQFSTEVLSKDDVVSFLKKNEDQKVNVYEAILPTTVEDTKYTKQGHTIIESIIYERNLPKVNHLKVNMLVLKLLDLLHSYTTDRILSTHRQHFSEQSYCQKAVNYISHHHTEKIKLEDVARELQLSSGYLSRIFKANIGCTLIEYVNYIKINTVKEILANRNAGLSELCEIIGIDDEKYLCRLFKKQTGMTITEFKATTDKSK